MRLLGKALINGDLSGRAEKKRKQVAFGGNESRRCGYSSHTAGAAVGATLAD
jgi:hypothetical protein